MVVSALLGQFVDGVEGGEVAVEDAEGAEVGFVDEAAGVVRLALVALDEMVSGGIEAGDGGA